MADLNPLIRVRSHAVEEKQKALAELYELVETLETEKAHILTTLDEEGKKLGQENAGEMMQYYCNYAENVRHRITDINTEVERLEGRIDVARDDMRAAFADLKKVEITQAEREKVERAAIDKKESDMLDEIALEGYRRKLDEDGEG